MASDTHAPLRKDVKLLGKLLGDTLREQGGPALFETVERVRSLAKKARSGHSRATQELRDLLASLDQEVLPVARAFAQFLALANIAEQHHGVRMRRRETGGPGSPSQPGTLEDAFKRLEAAGRTPAEIRQALCEQRVEPVFTAHPTEVVRRTLIQKHNRIAEQLFLRDRPGLTDEERREVEESLYRENTAIWLTDELRRTRPSPTDEARSGLIVLEESLWSAVPAFLRRLDTILRDRTGQGLPVGAAPIRFGSWIGGDRDGNPNVTAVVTRRVSLLHRWMAAHLFIQEVDPLRWELSMTRCDDAVRSRAGSAAEPYRELLREVRVRLLATRTHLEDRLADRVPSAEPIYEDPSELEEPLLLCYHSLRRCGAEAVAGGRLLDMIRRLSCFGLSMVRLDLRQESSRHTDALDAVTRHLGLGSYAAWPEEKRQKFLARELAGRRPLIPRDMPASPEVQEVFDTFQAAADQPGWSLGAYVISLAQNPSDVLAVQLLQKEARVEPPLRVVPLFESLQALDGAGEAVARLLDIPAYRKRVGDRQEVMIGYSDSARQTGRLAAVWALYRAQEDVVRVCRERGVRATLFHGRGGSVDRGGGPAHSAILSQPPGSVDGRLRVTEQGEVVQHRFGLPGTAAQTLELYTAAAVEATLNPPRVPLKTWRTLMDDLSRTAARSYRETVWESSRFYPYFRSVTPLEEIPRLKIGSRPARRAGGAGLESLRAIPWVFSWTQIRLMLPAWLGIGEAFAEAWSAGKGKTLQRMARDWPFFRSNLDLVEMVLAKADPSLTERYEEFLVPPELRDLGQQLRDRFDLTRSQVLRTAGHEELLEENPLLRRSIALRNPYVDPLNLLQVELLRRVREADDPGLHDALLVTINGIAAGMRNTG